MKIKTPKVYKRPCYYDHKNNRSRHVWGEWSIDENGERGTRRCIRCNLRSQFNLTSTKISNIFKKYYTVIDDIVYKESPLFSMLKRSKKMKLAGKVWR